MLLQQKRKMLKSQELIDKAVAHLATLKNNEDTRLLNQQAEKLEKDDAAAKDKEEKRKLFMESVYRSREAQISMKKKKKEARLKQDLEFAAQWQVQQKAIEHEE